ncbi:hypothetical protein CJD36_011040 [Flavipsychrobacter stenotrophus]|uniref:Uncharacterized protein n=2 Tax=Flavipsychrobacter stenotrophus TaxID=2077091 RepID=A0A2S7SUT6_9BACT|nr:hypothetical protein CJD36_011040 [Flavipsychrobacter stenotrophus]
MGGYTLILSLQQQHIQLNISSIVSSAGSSSLTPFSNINDNKDITWVDSNKEFYYKGTRYDVVRKDMVNGILESQLC